MAAPPDLAIIDEMALGVLIVDDQTDFRVIARALLERGGFEVLGEADSGAEAITAARLLRPDVVLLDVQLPDVDGFAIAAALTGHDDSPQVVMCSIRSHEDYGPSGELCGAVGFLTKSDLSAQAVRELIAPRPPRQPTP